jgi:hypothetical protein
MQVYYREEDEVWIGDLMFYRLSEYERQIADYERKQWPEKYPPEVTIKPYTSALSFDTAWRDVWPRKSIHLEDPIIDKIVCGHITVLDQSGNQYDFYTEKPVWVKETISIPRCHKVNKTPKEIEEERKEQEDEKKFYAAMEGFDLINMLGEDYDTSVSD